MRQRFALPGQLPALAPRWRRRLAPFWLLLLALAVSGQAGGLWRGYEEIRTVAPAFASLGLEPQPEERGFSIVVAGRDDIAEGSRLVAIDGRPIDPAADTLEAARRLAGADPSGVSVVLRAPDGTERTLQLARSAENRRLAALDEGATVAAGTLLLFFLLAFPFLAAAVLLWRRRDDAVSALLSFAFLALAAAGFGPLAFWETLGLLDLWSALTGLWLALLIVAFPAFPDGRFVPRWSRWMLVLGPAIGIAGAFDLLPAELGFGLLLILLLLSIGTLVIRFRRTPPGTARQQIKWAALGLIGGLALLVIGALLIAAALAVEAELAVGLLGLAGFVLLYLGFLLMPAGVIASLMRYRLNDADLVIGRSTGFAAATLVIGSLWAVGAYWTNDMIAAVAGRDNKGLAAALSALVAAALLGPARTRVHDWVERRFQPALTRLRALPTRLAQLQHGDCPRRVAEQALTSLVDGIEASRAALHDADGNLIAAVPAEADAEEEAVLRLPLADPSGPVAMLSIGARTDAAGYSRDQRAAVALVASPLADALRATGERAARNAELAAALAALEARLARLESRD